MAKLKAFVSLLLIVSFVFSPALTFAIEETVFLDTDLQSISTDVPPQPIETQIESTPTVSFEEQPAPVIETQVSPVEEVGEIKPLLDEGKGEETIQSLESSTIGPILSSAPLVTHTSKVNARVDTFSGAYIQTVPIEVPPGRNGMQPDIALRYSNQDNDSLDVGYGWQITIPFIERNNKTGIEKLYTDNFFKLSSGEELATTSVSGEYRLKDEQGAFLLYTFSSSTWIVTDKNGTEYTYGASQNTREYNPDITASSTKWMLEKIQDSNGNNITFSYTRDGNKLYPDVVAYTNNGVNSGIYEVSFLWESRPDQSVSYETGYARETNKRLKYVVVYVSDIERARYTLSYGSGINGYRSLLTSVTEARVSHNNATTTLPATTFEYANDSVAYQERNSATFSATATGGWVAENAILDTNNDGLVEIHASLTGDANSPLPYLGTIFTNHPTGTQSHNYSRLTRAWFNPSSQKQLPTNYFDFNGDGFWDILMNAKTAITPGNQELYTEMYIGATNGAFGATATTSWTGVIPTLADNYITTTGTWISFIYNKAAKPANINGDSLTDLYSIGTQCYAINTNAEDSCLPKGNYINHGNGWTAPPLSELASPYNNSGANEFAFADVNADGLDDLITSATSTGIAAYLNLGNNKFSSTSSAWAFPYGFRATGGYDAGTRILDLNSDGLVDILRGHKFIWNNNWDNVTGQSTPPDVDIKIAYLNTGSGWASSTFPVYYIYEGPIINVNNDWEGKFQFQDGYFDANGDGMVDFGNSIRTGRKPDILVKTAYSTGGTVDVEYKTTAQEGTHPTFPTPIQIVKKLTFTPNIGTPYIEEYAYTGAKNYYEGPNTLRFAGFKTVSITDVDSVKKLYFHQGEGDDSSVGEQGDTPAKIGKMFREEISDLSGNVFVREWNDWNSVSQGQGRNFAYRTNSVQQTYDGNGTHRDTATTDVRDTSNGNLSETTIWGEVTGSATSSAFTDIGSDRLITSLSYATSSGGILKPKTKETYDQSSNLVSRERVYYDNQSLGTITLGNETKNEKAITGSTYASTTKNYNGLGLVTSVRDANGNLTTLSYDTHNLYPASQTNALSHVTEYEYDYLTGKNIEVDDVNDIVTQFTYDGFGRPLSITVEHPQTASSTLKTTYQYTDTANAVSIQKTEYFDSNQALYNREYSYFDSLGRIIQTKKEAEDGNWVTKDTIYGPKESRIYQESLPYFSSSSAKTSSTTLQNLITEYEYDPLDRITHATNWVQNGGGFTAISTEINYDNWVKKVRDQNSKHKYYTSDAFGRLVQVNEFVSELTPYATTTYLYTALGNLSKITDASTNIRNFSYDLLGRLTESEDLHQVGDTTFGVYAFGYDAAGNIVSKTLPNAGTVAYQYDALNRLTTENYNGTGGVEKTIIYDDCTNGKGYRCEEETSANTIAYEYAVNGKPDSISHTVNSEVFETEYDYDLQGNTTAVYNPNNITLAYSYNKTGLPETVGYKIGASATTSLVSDFDYTPTGQVSYRANGNGTETQYTYPSGQLYRLTNLLTTIPEGGSMMMMGGGGGSGFDMEALEKALSLDTGSTTKVEPVISANKKTKKATTTISFEAKNPAGPISLLLKGQSSTKKANSKGDILSAFIKPEKIDRGLYTIEILGIESIEGGVQAFARVWDKGGAQLGFGKDGSVDIERFRIFNPPVLVSDGTYRENIKRADGSTESIEIPRFKENPKEAFLQSLEHTISVTGKRGTQIKQGKIGRTTSTFYPVSPGSGTGSMCGYVGRENDNETWSEMRDNSNAQYYGQHTDTATYAGTQNYASGGWKSLERMICTFNTSAILDNDEVYSATLSLYRGNASGAPGNNYDSISYHISSSTPAANDGIGAGDYDQVGSTSFGSVALSTFLSVDGYVNWNLNASGMANVSTTGSSGFSLRSSPDLTNTQPSGVNRFAVFYAGATGTANDPKLVVEHGGNTVAQSLSYVYDYIGNITQINDNRSGASVASSSYVYDDLHRLVSVSHNGTTTEEFEYSLIGNITEKNGETFSYQGTGYANPHALTLASSTSFTYDQAGNMTAGDMWTYGWDYENRLMSAGNGAATTTFAYAIDGDRIKKTKGSTTVLYINKNFEKEGATTTVYAWVGDTLLATITGNGVSTSTTYTHNDHLNSINITTDDVGNVQSRTEYYAYGDERTSVGNATDRTFLSRYAEDDLNLSYLTARYYAGNRGQFISQDPVFWEVGQEDFKKTLIDPQLQNSYGYGRGNPITFNDPNGESPLIAALYAAAPYISAGIEYISAAYTSYATAHGLGTVTGTYLSNAPQDYKQDVYNQALKTVATAVTLGQSTPSFSAGMSSPKQSNVLVNKVKGDAFRDSVAKVFESQGRVVQKEVMKQTPFGKRFIDIQVSDKNGKVLGGVETKTGQSRYLPSQQAKDIYLKTQGYVVNLIRRE